MKRWQWYCVAVAAGVVALEAFVYAQPIPNNCGVNMLCRVRTLIVSSTSTTGDLTVNGDAGVGGFTTLGRAAYTDNLVLDGGARLCMTGTGACTTNYLAGDTFGSVNGTGPWTFTNNVNVGGTLTSTDYFIASTGIKNTGTAAACSGNTGAVCVNDTGGLAIGDGSGNTVATVSAAGAAVFTSVSGSQSEWALPAVVSLGSVGSGVVVSQGVTSKAGTYKSATFTAQAAGVGAGNFVMKLCSDGATCAGGNTFATCTTACTSIAGTVATCTAGSATTYAAAATLSWSISTSCATDTIGNALAILANN